MAAFRLDTAAAIRKLEDAGVNGRQAAAIVDLHAAADADFATKADFDGLRTELGMVRTELKAEIEGGRTGLKAAIDRLRTELKADINGLRTELKADIEVVKASVDGLRTELKADINEISQRVDARLETDFAKNAADQQRRMNVLLGTMIALTGAILAGIALL